MEEEVLDSFGESMCENPEEEENWSIREIERHSVVQLQHQDQGEM